MEEITAIRLFMERGLIEAVIQTTQLITQDLKQTLPVLVENFQQVEVDQKVKVNITTGTGRETQTKIHRVLCGAIILLITKAVAHAPDGLTVHQTQQEGKTLIGAIVILPEAHMTVAREVAQVVVSQEVHHLHLVAAEDHVQEVGINSNNLQA
jgi:hypothetical protein